ncbi:hypothetical protein NM208_g3360 [Fusarium decemcellulare]|uniref:Uncharacterized protein n=1 Tax=Fusarium decemcellulare TaxID=57161 RepID=A0ACC1SPW4_9HYPO|nr:hypothetical protein NM208_g3360 [Fusarium decemcellulare]
MASQLGAAMVVWAASALGRELALHLSESKFSKLILVDEPRNLLSVVAQECRERGRPEADVLSLTCDFGNPQAIKDIMGQAAKEVGRIECVVNCASIDFFPCSTADLSVQQLQMPGELVERQASVSSFFACFWFGCGCANRYPTRSAKAATRLQVA